MRHIVTPVWVTLAQSSTTFRLVLQSPTRASTSLTGLPSNFGAAACQLTSGDRDGAWIVCPRRITLVRRETWFPGWSASSFRVGG
jgi:hypothetical protein